MDPQSVAEQFVGFYYKTFDENRAALKDLYRDESMMTFEGSPVQNASNIVEKLQVKHVVSTMDPQPSVNNGIIVIVTGQLLVDEEQRPMSYTQVFHLMPNGAGSFFVYNDIFRLVYG